MTDLYSEQVAQCATAALRMVRQNHPALNGETDELVRDKFAEFIVRNSLVSDREKEAKRLASFSFRWALTGMPRVVPGHKLAASLMCTSIPGELSEMGIMPWPCFTVVVPGGLIGASEQTVLVERVKMATGETGARLQYLLTSEAGQTAPGYICAPWSEFANPNFKETKHGELLMQLVFGCCLEMNAKENAEHIAKMPSGPPRMKRGEPKCWTLQLTRAVKCDMRAALREFTEGSRRGPPRVQGIVRGHWKHQPCGAGRRDRKFIHIEPYWRGPEDAPIAVRSHTIGDVAGVSSRHPAAPVSQGGGLTS